MAPIWHFEARGEVATGATEACAALVYLQQARRPNTGAVGAVS